MFIWSTMSPSVTRVSQEIKRLDFHQLCIRSAISVALIASTVKFISYEVQWLVETLRTWVR